MRRESWASNHITWLLFVSLTTSPDYCLFPVNEPDRQRQLWFLNFKETRSENIEYVIPWIGSDAEDTILVFYICNIYFSNRSNFQNKFCSILLFLTIFSNITGPVQSIIHFNLNPTARLVCDVDSAWVLILFFVCHFLGGHHNVQSRECLLRNSIGPCHFAGINWLHFSSSWSSKWYWYEKGLIVLLLLWFT